MFTSRLLRLPPFSVKNVCSTSKFHTGPILLAGHSKWANIRHDKAKNDAKKSRDAYTIATRIVTSVKSGGIEGNAQLVTLVDKAKKLNVNKKIIDNAIKRGTGEISNASNVQLSDMTYEFMGPGGVAFVIEATTDSKTRTIGLVKYAMSKFNASLSPCLYLFQRKGEIIFEPKEADETIDDVLDVAIDIGAEDVETYQDFENEYNGERLFRIITEPGEVTQISNKLSSSGYKLKDSKTAFMADKDNEVEFPDGQENTLKKAIEMLEDIPEVTNYYSNIKEENIEA